jgi:hypothetical protein
VTRGLGAGLAATASVAAFAAAFYLRLHVAYGPFNLSADPGDWTVLWELWRHGQIATPVVAQSVGVGLVAAAIPWLGFLGLSRRRRRGGR